MLIFLLQNSFPVEFFKKVGAVELVNYLPPKIGMLNICIQSVIQRKSEKYLYCSCLLCYDKVMEDDSYAKELKGS